MEREAVRAGDVPPATFTFELATGEEGTTIELTVPHPLRPLWEEYSGLASPEVLPYPHLLPLLTLGHSVHSRFSPQLCGE